MPLTSSAAIAPWVRPLYISKLWLAEQKIFGDRGRDDVRQALPAIFLRRRQASSSRRRTNWSQASLKPGGVVTDPSSLRLQPSSSPTRLSGCSTSSQKLAALVEDRLDQVGRGVGEARQVRIAAELQHMVEDEARFAHGGGVDRHSAVLLVESGRRGGRRTLRARRSWRRCRASGAASASIRSLAALERHQQLRLLLVADVVEVEQFADVVEAEADPLAAQDPGQPGAVAVGIEARACRAARARSAPRLRRSAARGR